LLPSLALIIAALAVVAFVQNPTGSLMPMGLLVCAFYGAFCLLPAWAGAAVRRRVDRPKMAAERVTEE
jgi:hypothetical protein